VSYFAERYTTPQFVERVQQERDLVLSTFRSAGLSGGHERQNALAVRRDIHVLETVGAADRLLVPNPRLVGCEGIAVDAVGHGHDALHRGS
jgi:hypothetical protein